MCFSELQLTTKTTLGGVTVSQVTQHQDKLLQAFAAKSGGNAQRMRFEKISAARRIRRGLVGGVKADVVTDVDTLQEKQSVKQNMKKDTFKAEVTAEAQNLLVDDGVNVNVQDIIVINRKFFRCFFLY